MYRALSLMVLASMLAGCRSYVESTPSKLVEGDHPVNYARVFRETVPSDVTVVNSAVVTYGFRPGVVTTDDYEFELIVTPSWVQRIAKRFYLRKSDGEFIQRRLGARRDQARPWYAPKPLTQYELYLDATSVGYVHMLVDKTEEADGKQRFFISKH